MAQFCDHKFCRTCGCNLIIFPENPLCPSHGISSDVRDAYRHRSSIDLTKSTSKARGATDFSTLKGEKDRGRRESKNDKKGDTASECPICHSEMDKARIHYGGISCYSCRAFFRRSTQKDLIRCKFGRSCYIDLKQRKTCPSCRYERCLR